MRIRTPARSDVAAAGRPAGAEAPAAAPGDAKRRRFLAALGAAGAGVAAAAVSATPEGGTAGEADATTRAKGAGYRETAHVRNYYRSARF